ncbi:MAG: DUF2262 domain-containing protein [Akkermansiaceae bacterium]|nr:DUF2262 domain-containing protein [Armatimonadota bacterium]
MSKTITDPVMGKLSWDDSDWAGDVSLSSRKKTTLHISAPEETEEIPDALRERFSWIIANDKRLRLAVAERMRGDVWSENEEDQNLPAEAFAERLAAENIDILSAPKPSEEGDTDFTIWYDDDMLYGGHVLISDFTKKGELLRVEVHG